MGFTVLLRTIDVSENPTGVATIPAHPIESISLERQVQNGLNLILPLKNPAQMPALVATIASVMDDVHSALAGLHYPHFARFLPIPDGSALTVITSYDGELDSYIMDFVAVMGDIFTTMLQFMKGAPPLPVHRFPNEFLAYLKAHNVSQAGVWSAYPDLTLLDILKAAGGR
jgi:hypothetical protein